MGYEDSEILAEFLFNSKHQNTDQTSLRVTRVYLNDSISFKHSKSEIFNNGGVSDLDIEFESKCEMKSGHNKYACVGREEVDLTEGSNEKVSGSGNDEWLSETNREVSSETEEQSPLTEEEQLMMQMGLPVSFIGSEVRNEEQKKLWHDIIKADESQLQELTKLQPSNSENYEGTGIHCAKYNISVACCLKEMANAPITISENAQTHDNDAIDNEISVKKQLSPEEKFDVLQSTMQETLIALRCNWSQSQFTNSKFKSVHVKFCKTASRRKRYRKKQFKSTESEITDNWAREVAEKEVCDLSCSENEAFKEEGSDNQTTFEKVVANLEDESCREEGSEDAKLKFPELKTDLAQIQPMERQNHPENENVSKSAKKARRPFRDGDLQGKVLEKYWSQRYRIFSKFDHGCLLDEESWFSITPEKIAEHHANRCYGDVILDAFCGSGGNSIQFGFTCEHVIGVDIDPEKVAIARHNAKVYGVADRIDFIASDFLELEPFEVDALFLSPPWGGPNYLECEVFDCETMITPPLSKLLSHARKFSYNIAVLLPKNIDAQQIMNMYAKLGEYIEIEQNYLSNKLKTVTIYFNDLVRFEDQ